MFQNQVTMDITPLCLDTELQHRNQNFLLVCSVYSDIIFSKSIKYDFASFFLFPVWMFHLLGHGKHHVLASILSEAIQQGENIKGKMKMGESFQFLASDCSACSEVDCLT